MSRFSVKYTDQELIQIVGAIAKSVSPEDPLSVTQKQFDEAREKNGFSGAPSAYRITVRLKRGWKEVLELSLGYLSKEQSLSLRGRVVLRETLTRAEVENYLQAAARDLNTRQLSVAQYDQYRERLIDEDERRFVHREGLAETIPSSLTIIQAVGTWEKALIWADLERPPKSARRFYPADQALDDFIADYGFAPLYNMLLEYQAKRGVVTEPFLGNYRAWRDEQLKNGLASRHGNVPTFTHSAQLPDDWESTPITPAPEGYEKVRRDIDLDQCRADLIKAIRLAEGKALTQDLYQQISKEHQLLSMSAMQRVAKTEANLTWGQLRDQAIEENTLRPRTQSRRPRT